VTVAQNIDEMIGENHRTDSAQRCRLFNKPGHETSLNLARPQNRDRAAHPIQPVQVVQKASEEAPVRRKAEQVKHHGKARKIRQ
jgi:hypothetical protein